MADDDIIEDAAFLEEWAERNARAALGAIVGAVEEALTFEYPVAQRVATTLRVIGELAAAELERVKRGD